VPRGATSTLKIVVDKLQENQWMLQSVSQVTMQEAASQEAGNIDLGTDMRFKNVWKCGNTICAVSWQSNVPV
jgi:hypothetical protein